MSMQCRLLVRITVLFGGLILPVAGQAQAPVLSSPADWLQAMHHAVHHLNYEGHVVYQVGSDLEVMHLHHEGKATGEVEHLNVLSGTPHQILRGSGAMHHIQGPDEKQQSHDQHVLDMNCLFDYQQMLPHYRLRLGEKHRVAGRLAQILYIEPQDALRYGRRLYLDQETKLPLRSVLLDHQQQPLAQTLFTDLTLKKSPMVAMQHPSHNHTDKSDLFAVAQRWQFVALPAGFKMKLHHYLSQEKREHFIFSDGLSMISLYIEPWVKGSLEGFSKQGATWILGARRHNQRMTLLGKVPQETLLQVVDAARPTP
ncbi:MAG: MucB/RseB C-terminal domain-containing protein [Pseudomonadota bacterium]